MAFASADLTIIAGLARRKIANRISRTLPLNFRGLSLSRINGLGLTFPALLDGDASRAAELYKGVFDLGGCRVLLRGASRFSPDETRPQAFDEALHGFSYLHDLRTAGGQLTRVFARGLVGEWLEERANTLAVASETRILSHRLINWVQCAPFLLDGASKEFETAFFSSLTSQTRMLAAGGQSALQASDRLFAAIALTMVSLGTVGMDSLQKLALQRLCTELDNQILMDGGHISRSGQTLCEALSLLMPLRSIMQQSHLEVPEPVNASIERMLPMLRFMRHNDGRLATFQGVARTHRRLTQAVLDEDKTGGKPLSHATSSGFARMAHGKTSVLVDVGQPAPPSHATASAASALAMEFCDGTHQIVVSCGSRPDSHPAWKKAARLTSAHSTICAGDKDTAELYDGALLSKLFGTGFMLQKGGVDANCNTGELGTIVTGRHSCYERDFGLACERQLFLDASGHDLRGEDSFNLTEDATAAEVPLQLRFHLHPSVKATLSRDASTVMLVLPNKTGWKFSARGGSLGLEASIYLPDMRSPRPSQQIVITALAPQTGRVQWAFKRIAKSTVGNTSNACAPQLPLDAG